MFAKNDPVINANQYSEHNSLQKTDNLHFFKNYLHQTSWKEKEDLHILDIGTGDGTTLIEVIVPYLPTNVKNIVATDLNKKMLSIAKKKAMNNPNIKFFCFDIGSVALPEQLCGKFDKIFSFYCLNWVPNQRQAFQNIIDMLVPGGDVLLTVAIKHFMYGISERLANLEKWSDFKTYITQFESVYYFSKNPLVEIESHLKKAGFVDYKCELVDRCHTYQNLEEFLDWASPVNPQIIIKKTSQGCENSYREDFISEAVKIIINEKYCKNGVIEIPHQVAVITASKPLENE